MMGTVREHREKAAHNERFFAVFDLDGTDFRDWAVTVLLYSGMHHLTAVAASKGIVIAEYARVDSMLARDLSHLRGSRDARNAFRHLRDDSWAARYDPKVSFTPNDVRTLEGDLGTIRRFVAGILGPPP